MRPLRLVLFLSFVCVYESAAAEPPHLVLAGDSTVAKHPKDPQQAGWGEALPAFLKSGARVTNLAKGGASTLSFRNAGLWDQVLAAKPDYVLIQFGHNDQPGKPGRSTDLAREFPDNLRRYVREVRAAGALPVLLTPLTRRQFRDGVLGDDLAPWADATRRVAAELGVPLVDLHARSMAAVQGMGPVQAMRFALAPASAAQVSAAQAGTTIGAPPANAANIGNKVPFVPENSFSLWTTYEISQHLPVDGKILVGGGVTYADGYYVNSTNLGEVPSNFTFDAMASYELDGWRFALNGYNLTDELNYDAAFGNRAVVAPGRSAVFTIGKRF